MALRIDTDIKDLINRDGTIKLLSTLDEDGNIRTVANQHIRILDSGAIEYLEFLETSITYRNFTRSLWFENLVTISTAGENGENYIIRAKPVKIIICGPLFEERYKSVTANGASAGLVAVCVMEPVELIDETFSHRAQHEKRHKPIYTHLDRLAAETVTASIQQH